MMPKRFMPMSVTFFRLQELVSHWGIMRRLFSISYAWLVVLSTQIAMPWWEAIKVGLNTYPLVAEMKWLLEALHSLQAGL